MEKIKKLFGGINLTWKKLIIFPIATAVRLLIDLSNPYFIDENGELKIGIPVAVLTNQEYNELINGKKSIKIWQNF